MAFNKPNAPKEVVFNRYDGGDSKILKKVNYGLQESMRVLALILPPIGNELQMLWRGLLQKAAGSELCSDAVCIGIRSEANISSWLMS
eukprot:scaffold444_cov42-Cyclotella_meneghiniana.AAC.9